MTTDGLIRNFRNFLNDAVGYDLNLYDNTIRHEEDWEWQKYTLTGQVYGFGKWGGNHDADEYLQSKLPQEILDGINLDSESGQFFAYSDDVTLLRAIVNQFDSAMDLVEMILS